MGQCSPLNAILHGNTRCVLALDNLPKEVHEREWDLIMIDAPRGYFAEALGRISVILSATVMARNRKGSGKTHVFLHDGDRTVEKMYAEEFLCSKSLVKGVESLNTTLRYLKPYHSTYHRKLEDDFHVNGYRNAEFNRWAIL
jgi:uncharacterized protein (TIGR01627 family)